MIWVDIGGIVDHHCLNIVFIIDILQCTDKALVYHRSLYGTSLLLRHTYDISNTCIYHRTQNHTISEHTPSIHRHTPSMPPSSDIPSRYYRTGTYPRYTSIPGKPFYDIVYTHFGKRINIVAFKWPYIIVSFRKLYDNSSLNKDMLLVMMTYLKCQWCLTFHRLIGHGYCKIVTEIPVIIRFEILQTFMFQ